MQLVAVIHVIGRIGFILCTITVSIGHLPAPSKIMNHCEVHERSLCPFQPKYPRSITLQYSFTCSLVTHPSGIVRTPLRRI